MSGIDRVGEKAVFYLFCLLIVASCGHKPKGESDYSDDPNTTSMNEYGIPADSLNISYYRVEKGDFFSTILFGLGFDGSKIAEICNELSTYYPHSTLKIGSRYATLSAENDSSTIKYLVFEKNIIDYVVLDFNADEVRAYESSKPVVLKREYVEGTITSSLWNSLIERGVSVLLALKMSDIYAWQIDFFDVKEGDSYRIMYDALYIDDTTFVDIATVEGAVFTHRERRFKAIPFEQDSIREFFDDKGNSLRREFLKAPLDFFRISSRFSNSRFHPVLKIYRPHHGVDYAAPTGTPIKTIGDGVVIEKGYQRNGAGNYLKIKHNSVYSTIYMHMSRFAKGIERGSRVTQGETIGYVGATGLATGPHLDFRVLKNNQPINPLTMEAPPSNPVRPELMDSFIAVYDNVLNELDSLRDVGYFYVSGEDSLSYEPDKRL